MMDMLTEKGRLAILMQKDAETKRYLATIGKALKDSLDKLSNLEQSTPKLYEQSNLKVTAIETKLEGFSKKIESNIRELLRSDDKSQKDIELLTRKTENLVNLFAKSTKEMSNEIAVMKKIVDSYALISLKERQDGKDGKGIERAYLDAGKLILVYTDGTQDNLGKVTAPGNDMVGQIRKGGRGDPGTGIASITLTSGDHSPGTLDTYTIAYTDTSVPSITYQIYNGADGLAVVRDNLTTQSATDALSANQGYVLNNLVSTISARTNDSTEYLWMLGTTNGTAIITHTARMCNTAPTIYLKGDYAYVEIGMTLSFWRYTGTAYTKISTDVMYYEFTATETGIIIFRYDDGRVMTLETDSLKVHINEPIRENEYDLKLGSLEVVTNNTMSFTKVELFKKDTLITVGNGMLMTCYYYANLSSVDFAGQVFQDKSAWFFEADTYVRIVFKLRNTAVLIADYISYIKKNIFIKRYDSIKNPYNNFKLGCLGDSLSKSTTSDSGVGDIYDEEVQNNESIMSYKLGLHSLLDLLEVYNYGVNSSTIAENSGGVPDVLPFIDRYSAMADDCNLVFVWGGINDCIFQTPIGTLGDTGRTTFYGALDILCKGLVNKYIPINSKILFCTPTNSSSVIGKVIPLSSYINAIKEVCRKFSIPVLDMNIESGLTTEIPAIVTKYMADGTHPCGLIHAKTFAPIIANKFKQLI